MTTAGWILMLVSNAFVIGLTVFCLRRVLAKPSSVTEKDLPPTA